MPKPRGGVFKAAKRDTRYAAVIEAAMPPNHPWNTPHKTPVIPDQDRALDVQRGIYRSARHAGITAHHVTTVCTGCKALLQTEHKASCNRPGWVVSFQLTSKSEGKRAIVEHVKAGGKLSYNLRRNQ
jgi:hypothetical protein